MADGRWQVGFNGRSGTQWQQGYLGSFQRQEAFSRPQEWFPGLHGAERTTPSSQASQVLLVVGPQPTGRRSLLAQSIDSAGSESTRSWKGLARSIPTIDPSDQMQWSTLLAQRTFSTMVYAAKEQ